MVFGPLSLSFGRKSLLIGVRSLETGLKPYFFQSLHLEHFLNLLMNEGFWSLVSSARRFPDLKLSTCLGLSFPYGFSAGLTLRYNL